MKINNEFTVAAPIQQAWDTMLNLERIAPCLPGAAIQEEKEEGEYDGTMKVKIGPITANYKGTVKFEEVDEENHRAVLQATGRDARGQGTASATIVSTLQEEGEGTKVSVETDMKLTGRAAQFGRGIAQDVATKMLDQFASCLEEEITGGPEEGAAAATAEPSRRGERLALAGGRSSPGRRDRWHGRQGHKQRRPDRHGGRHGRGSHSRRPRLAGSLFGRPDRRDRTALRTASPPPRTRGAGGFRHRCGEPGGDPQTGQTRAHRRRRAPGPDLAPPPSPSLEVSFQQSAFVCR